MVNKLVYGNMLKKSIILALLLLVSGSAGLGWVLTEQRKENQLVQHLQQKLKVNLESVNKLIAGETEVNPAASITSIEHLQRALNRYKTQRDTRELILTGSIVFIGTAWVIFSWLLLLAVARLAVVAFGSFEKSLINLCGWQQEAKPPKPAKTDTKKNKKDLKSTQKAYSRQGPLKRWSSILTNSGWHNFKEPAGHRVMYTKKDQSEFVNNRNEQNHLGIAAILKNGFHSDESVQTDGQTGLQEATQSSPSEDIGQGTIKHSEPLSDTLMELTEQVSAIREYACRQQGKMERFQDGYDWNIIKNFCLRVIHCIDNLENRIRYFSGQNIYVAELEEVRDELLFALESSGVERFEPEINSDYHGQEKSAEAIKDKEYCEDTNLVGKIAKIVRPGYQYITDETNVKVLRTVQVKLFGQFCKIKQEV